LTRARPDSVLTRERHARVASATRTKGRPEVVLVQSALPDYRRLVVEGLGRSLEARLVVVTGESGFEPTVRFSPVDAETIVVRNVYFPGRRLLWQHGSVRPAIAATVSIVELNPRVISNWIALAVRRLFRRPTLAWGHAWPRAGRSSRSERIRGLMRRCATDVLVYTHSEADALAQLMPEKRIHAAPNGLYPARLAIQDAETRPGRDVIYVGRLVQPKKPLLLLEAFAGALPRLPDDTSLVIVGDGELLPRLRDRARELGVADRVRFTGHVNHFETLSVLYRDALVSVSPGYAGLSVIQSHWFGVPMIIARDEPHAPEIEAAVEGENAMLVDSDSATALAAALVDVFDARARWLARGPDIAARCVERYAIETAVRSFATAIRAHLT
jgi:glycosyltransferase involved in cell wall biosynthesis